MSYATKEQLEELASYMASQINVPTIGIGGGYAPIGTIISYMGTTAPQDYLACDGDTHNISDYPQLADFFEAQFGSKNYFGGDGVTTFAVPDLQGEFLRGTGTNSHTNQGSGANVGVHQDGTWHLSGVSSSLSISQIPDGMDQNIDHYYNNDIIRRTIQQQSSSSGAIYTSRPTNTSILWCIKAVVAGEVYSTEERVVGTWINGKPIYQKVFQIDHTVISNNTECAIADLSLLSIDKLISFTPLTRWSYEPYSQTGGNVATSYWFDSGNDKVKMKTSTAAWFANDFYILTKYTKTTD